LDAQETVIGRIIQYSPQMGSRKEEAGI